MTIDEQINALAAKQTNDIQALGVVTFEQASANAVFDARRTALLLAVLFFHELVDDALLGGIVITPVGVPLVGVGLGIAHELDAPGKASAGE